MPDERKSGRRQLSIKVVNVNFVAMIVVLMHLSFTIETFLRKTSVFLRKVIPVVGNG